MRGNITLNFLEFVKDFANLNMDMFEAFLRAGYGASYGKLNYELNKLQRERWRQDIKQEEISRHRKRYNQFLYRLRQDKLLNEKVVKNKIVILLTEKGREKLEKLKEKYLNKLPAANLYGGDASDKFIIVAFDIPEKERRKRDWIRDVLQNLNLKSIQKSLWIGKVKIPKQLINDLSELKMLDYVEIFEISKTGSLRHLI